MRRGVQPKAEAAAAAAAPTLGVGMAAGGIHHLRTDRRNPPLGNHGLLLDAGERVTPLHLLPNPPATTHRGCGASRMSGATRHAKNLPKKAIEKDTRVRTRVDKTLACEERHVRTTLARYYELTGHAAARAAYCRRTSNLGVYSLLPKRRWEEGARGLPTRRRSV